ncbi:glycosyltransferase [Citrus sinensis]|uniref:Glycosyltransferase n=1 Tax=Citrus sinensis TaxID=2711 RepID=A0ACB8L644_CITSI|nr:glycosyltransferase [Citrus sinensis]
MFPWLAQGHAFPFLELAKKLAKRSNFHICFCSTPSILNSIKQSDKFSLSIQLIELHLPSLPELPPQYHTTKGFPPHLMPTLEEAFDMASPSFFNILKNPSPDLLIYDLIQPWAPALASSLNIPAVYFLVSSAATSAFMFHGIKKNSSGKYIDYLSDLIKKKVVPVDPLVQDPVEEDDHEKGVMEIIQWLDKKERSSTVFVSFGIRDLTSVVVTDRDLTGVVVADRDLGASITSAEKANSDFQEEMEDIALGLELSGVNFIWVVRFPCGAKSKVDEELPKSFLERTKERAMVIEGWAPQMKILGHPSIGGFGSHCGWSSVMESMKLGVPIIGMPMHLDQPLNARLVEDVGIGLEVRRNKCGRIQREEMARVIKEVVMEKDGGKMKRKTREMGEAIKEKGEEEIEWVADELIHLCG